MANIPERQQIVPEDFKKDEQELVGKIAGPINTYIEQLNEILNQNLTFGDNIRGVLKVVQVVGGTPLKFRYGRTDKPVGIWLIDYANVSTPAEVLTVAVQPQWTYDGVGGITLDNVTGLTGSDIYNLTLIIISG